MSNDTRNNDNRNNENHFFTQEVLDKRIQYLIFVNIQSIRRAIYEIPKNGVVRIEAKSNIGKSAAYRALETFLECTINQKQTRDSLITDNKLTSAIGLKQYNGTELYLIIKPNVTFYFMKTKDGVEKQYPATSLPLDIKNALNFHIYTSNDKSVSWNLRETETILYVNTPDRMNSEMLNSVLDNSFVDAGIKQLSDAESSLSIMEQQINNIVYKNKVKYDDIQIPNYDEEYIDMQLKAIDEYIFQLETIELSVKSTHSLISVIDKLNSRLNTAIHTNLKLQSIEKFRELNAYENMCTALKSSVQSIYSDKHINLSDVVETLDKLKLYYNYVDNLTSLSNAVDIANIKLNDVCNLHRSLDNYKAYSSYENMLTTVKSMLTELKLYEQFNKDIENTLQQCKAITNCITSMHTLNEKISTISNTSTSIKVNNRRIAELKKELKICKYCGGKL